MPPARRPYRREGEDSRRAALIAATQSLVAEGGPQAATLRAIAGRAGVTAGLIRHYFQTKEGLIRAAFLALMQGMTDIGADAARIAAATAPARLAAFIAAALRPPVLSADAVVLWAGYMHKLRNDPELLSVHETSYLAYRTTLQDLIAALPRQANPARIRAEAIAINALVDGLWIEGALLPNTFAGAEVLTIGLTGAGAILGIDLMNHTELLPEFRKPAG